ncbi:MAG TPA: 5-oxoprolinase subunit PxpB [Pyrinomonadaceae bacterium]|nr:5-oxoprolinase subunit PxpB [Pyrinomonadaceae bacterium]
MTSQYPRIFPLGDSALTVEFGSEISKRMNEQAIALSRRFEENIFPGFIESVPAYASTTVFFDIKTVRHHFADTASAFEAVSEIARNLISQPDETAEPPNGLIEIPVSFDAASALDLTAVSDTTGLSPEHIIDTFLERTYRVFMIGFLPGFAYMGEVAKRIAVPRKDSPRLRVPKGSVGIAGRQTGIYSLESPGGWPIIGRTDVDMFTPLAESPSLLKPGDAVRFLRAK